MKLRKSDLQLLDLAPESLQSLSFQASSSSEEHRRQLRPDNFYKLTGLTQLQLVNEALDIDANCSPLQRLDLQELVLIDCPRADRAILAPGAFRGLEILHIDGCDAERGSPDYDSDASVLEESEQIRIGSILRGMPHLKQLSGRSDLFQSGLAGFMEGWQEVTRYEHDWSALSKDPHRYIPFWIKP